MDRKSISQKDKKFIKIDFFYTPEELPLGMGSVAPFIDAVPNSPSKNDKSEDNLRNEVECIHNQVRKIISRNTAAYRPNNCGQEI